MSTLEIAKSNRRSLLVALKKSESDPSSVRITREEAKQILRTLDISIKHLEGSR
jgi:DNA-directed RNA polymerase subunit H (RpoH/RPB5)